MLFARAGHSQVCLSWRGSATTEAISRMGGGDGVAALLMTVGGGDGVAVLAMTVGVGEMASLCSP